MTNLHTLLMSPKVMSSAFFNSSASFDGMIFSNGKRYSTVFLTRLNCNEIMVFVALFSSVS